MGGGPPEGGQTGVGWVAQFARAVPLPVVIFLAVWLSTGLPAPLLTPPLAFLAGVCCLQDGVVTVGRPRALLPLRREHPPTDPVLPARLFAAARVGMFAGLAAYGSPQWAAWDLAAWAITTALVKGPTGQPTSSMYSGPSYLRWGLQAVSRQSLGSERALSMRPVIRTSAWTMAVLLALGSLASIQPYGPTRHRIHVGLSRIARLPYLSPEETPEPNATGQAAPPHANAFVNTQSAPIPVTTTLPWTCSTYSLKNTRPDASDLMDIAWKRRGSVAIGCPTGESAQTGAGAIVVYLTGGTASESAAVVGRMQEPERAAVVLSPHTTLLRALVGDGVLVGAYPALALSDSTVTVFETTAGCYTSVARYKAALAWFTIGPAATMVLARSLRVLGGRMMSIRDDQAEDSWSVTIRLRDGNLTSIQVDITSTGARIARGPQAIRALSVDSEACDIDTIGRTLAARM